MKASKEHRVPLSAPALALLNAMPRESDFIFPGPRKGTALGNLAMARLLKRMGGTAITVHGFRSTFRDEQRCRRYSTSYMAAAKRNELDRK